MKLDHAGALRLSSRITSNLRHMYQREAVDVQPHDVVKVLNAAGVRFTLLGAHAIAGWLDEPRATQDVDLLIHSRHRRAVQAVQEAFPSLTVEDLPAVTRFVDPKTRLGVIDLIKSRAALLKAVARNVYQVGKTHQIPDLEMALALKYAAMLSPSRALKKQRLDEADFIGMVKQNYGIIDKRKLQRLALLAGTQGDKDILAMIEDAYADRPIRK